MNKQNKFNWVTDLTDKFMQGGYLSEGETVESRVKAIADHAEKLLGIEGFSDKFYDYMSKGYFSLSSPVWSNFAKERGLPVSCFNSHVGDSVERILFAQSEVGEMSKLGGGTSGYFGDIRPRGAEIKDNGHTSGSVHFMQLFQTMIDVVSQGSVRRGRFSPYLPIEHPDANEFLDIGSEGNVIQELTHGITVTDKFMQEMIDGDSTKRKLWAKVIQRRGEMGYPYILFKDTANNNTVDVYKDKNMTINSSNLCSEILLPSNDDESFVCVLSSMNLLHYDEWKDTDAVETLTYFLDAVVTELLQKLEVYRDSDDRDNQLLFRNMERAYNFSKKHRALGLGVLGWHSLLQSKMLPFEGRDAAKLNLEVFKFIKEKSYKASEEMAKLFGEPELLKGYGRRNTTLNAIAPTTSSAFILGQVSQSIEPIWSNCYVKDLAKIKTTIKNPFLEQLLEDKRQNTKEVWKSIKESDGSVQHLDILTDEEKAVFRTFAEISPDAIINQASTRQTYLDQTQSLNLLLDPTMSTKDVNALYITAWKMGIPTLYYQHSINAAQSLSRKKLDSGTCVACEG